MKTREQRFQEWVAQYPELTATDFNWYEARLKDWIEESDRVYTDLLKHGAKPMSDADLMEVALDLHRILDIIDAELQDRGM